MNQEYINLTSGALLIAALLSWCLYGFIIMQFYIYYTHPTQSKDSIWLRGTVHALCALESILTLMISHNVWVNVVEWYGTNIWEHGTGTWTAAVTTTITGIVGSIVQIFYARRIWILSEMSRKGLAISIVIVLLALVQGILAFLITIKFFQNDRDPQQTFKVKQIYSTWLCISLACDSIITIAVIAFLRRARGTITGALRDLMNKFILKSLETGVLVALAAAAELFLFRLYPFTYLSVVSLFMLSRLYTMALLASLNGRTRASLVDREHVHTVSTWRVATIPFSMAMKSQN